MTPQHPLSNCPVGSVSKANGKDLTGEANAASIWVIGESRLPWTKASLMPHPVYPWCFRNYVKGETR